MNIYEQGSARWVVSEGVVNVVMRSKEHGPGPVHPASRWFRKRRQYCPDRCCPRKSSSSTPAQSRGGLLELVERNTANVANLQSTGPVPGAAWPRSQSPRPAVARGLNHPFGVFPVAGVVHCHARARSGQAPFHPLPIPLETPVTIATLPVRPLLFMIVLDRNERVFDPTKGVVLHRTTSDGAQSGPGIGRTVLEDARGDAPQHPRHFIQPLKERLMREVGHRLSLKGASAAALVKSMQARS